MKSIIPAPGWLLIEKVDLDNKTESGLALPTQVRTSLQVARVVELGSYDGTLLLQDVAEEDLIVVEQADVSPLNFQGKAYGMVKRENIMAVIDSD